MVTVSVISGSREAGLMVFTEPVPPMLKLIVSAPAVSFDSWMAARNVHWMPLSDEESHTLLLMFMSLALPVLLTVKVVAASAGPDHSARRSTPKSASAIADIAVS